MKKKSIALVSALVSVSMLFTSCAKDNNVPEKNNNSTESVPVSVDEMKNTATEKESSSSAKVTIDGTKFYVDGKEIWFNGVNTPWDNWNDFGGDFDEDFWDTHFAELHEKGVNSSRVWINCNSMIGVKLKTTGEIKEVTEKHWADLDKLFEIAKKHEIYIMATLLSFDHFKDENSGYKNWRLLVSDEANTQSFIDNYVIPFAKRYDDNDYLWSIDLMNEPDWVVENKECGQLNWDVMSAFFAKCTAAIHENSDILVTVGMGMIKYNSDIDKYSGNMVSDEIMKKLGSEKSCLDFYSTHYYDWQASFMGYPFDKTPEAFGLETSKPSLIGEWSANGGTSGKTIESQYEGAYNNGWCGVLVWTSNGVDGNGTVDDASTGLNKIMEIAPEKVFPLS